MVASRILAQQYAHDEPEAALRATVRDLVALSSLPAIWINADPRQIARGLAQLIVSMLDADFCCVALSAYSVDVAECHNRRLDAKPFDWHAVRQTFGGDAVVTLEDKQIGRLRVLAVPVGRDAGSQLVVASGRSGFPSEIDRTLMRVAANQAGLAIAHWESAQRLVEQKRNLEVLNQTNTALFRLTDRLYRAQSYQAMYEAALDTIFGALGCPRASILLLDNDGVMRFVAWRGLSEGYRKAVEGHSPWQPGTSDPQPICIPNLEAVNLSDTLQNSINAEGIRALAFIPLTANGSLIGKFMTYYERPHDFAASEVDLALTIARQLGFSLEMRHTDERLRDLNETLERRVEERTGERDSVWRNSRDLLAVVGKDGIFRAANPAWRNILGYAPDVVVGRNFRDFVFPEDVNLAAAGFQKIESGENLTGFEVRWQHTDGTPRWISWHTSLEGDIIYAYGRDVTSNKVQEAALAEAEIALRQSQKMEAVGQLTGGIAHDFNNMLQGIIGALDRIKQRIADGRIDDLDRFVKGATESALRAATMTQRLLAFSRRQALAPKSVNLDSLIEDVVELARLSVGPSIEICVLGKGAWETVADPSQLENALLNLCINARDAMPNGGTITIETANKSLNALAAASFNVAAGDYISLCITDTGTGMSPEVKRRAFDPFFTTKPLGQGTGLGLSMIYGFAQQSGGHVHLTSDVGNGTSVYLYLPRNRGGEITDDKQASIVPVITKGADQTILVVDDEAIIRMMIMDAIEGAGYRGLEAPDGASGLSILQSDALIDLLVTDVGLPGSINGRQLADAARLKRPGLKVLFITGYAEALVAEQGKLEPDMEILPKPFMLEALTEKIREMIQP